MTGATSPTISGAYLTLTSLADVVSWSLKMNKNVVETTALGDTWKEYTAVEIGATLTIQRWHSDVDSWLWLASSKSLVFKIWEDGTSGFWCTGIVTACNPSAAVGQVQSEAITATVQSIVGRF